MHNVERNNVISICISNPFRNSDKGPDVEKQFPGLLAQFFVMPLGSLLVLGLAYSLSSDSLCPFQVAGVGIMMPVVKQIKSVAMILFSDLYQEHYRDQLFSLSDGVQRKPGLQM
jgi:hypothetical protein